jgi:hypothetical protein
VRRLAVFALALASVLVSSPPALGGEAGLIIRSGDEVDQMCVAFEGDETTGAELLIESGIEYVEEEGSLGTAICSIEGEGCGRDDCFCDYPRFWGYWTKDDDTEEWRFSDVGAADRVVRSGTLDGWSFGKDGKPPPPDIAFADVCNGEDTRAIPGLSSPATSAHAARPNYVPFAAFAALLIAAGFAVVALRRRRTAR